MKIVVMSDTHLSRVTDDFSYLCSEFCDNADMVIHLGDWESVAILNYLEQYRLEAVCGNMDDHTIRERLPAVKVIRVGDFRLGLTHGWGSPNGIRRRIGKEFKDVDAILFGHTHQPLALQENGLLWFNPGSVYLGRGDARRSIGILSIKDTIRPEIINL